MTNDSAPEYAPDLSPNDNEIAWHKWINGARQLFVKRIDSDSVTAITSGGMDQGVPRWSPTGPRSPRGVTTRNGGGVFTPSAQRRWRMGKGLVAP